MLENIHIRNYRGLYDLHVEELRRINLITGNNRAGKTSFLEALYMLCCFGNPRAAALPAIVRSRDSHDRSPEAIRETWWAPMFSDFDLDKAAEISGHHSKVNDMSLKIRLVKSDALEFDFNVESDKPVRNQIRINDDGKIESTQKNIRARFPVKPLFSTESLDPAEYAILLDKLREEKKSDLVLETLKLVEPRLAGIEADAASGEPLIWCDIGLPRRIPLRAMGDAINRVARLMIAIYSTPDGIVLFDEFEHELHHSVLRPAWKAVHQAAKEFNVQVFATARSYECIRKARAAMSEETDWLLHRFDPKSGKNRSVIYEPEDVATAIHFNMEVR